ncbi:hypothetical protein LCGC14_0318010 [marine sediment metagenome]|uniref:Restriction alleviation protein, Lar family n=1 Tax=marine sediment metagenome TaxID=412755 RepID=A0A0F9U2J9_9ZZZZ
MKIELCPHCPGGGDISVACTNLEGKNEYQVWCRDCWAHGPSRKTKEGAIESWNETAGPIRPGADEEGRRMVAIESDAIQAGGCNGCSRRVRYVWVIHLGQSLEWRLCRQCRDELVEQTRRAR